MDSVKSGGMVGIVPTLENRARIDEDGAGGSHMTIPRFNYKRKNNYYGGYFLLMGTGFGRDVRSSRRTAPGEHHSSSASVRNMAAAFLCADMESASHSMKTTLRLTLIIKTATVSPQVRFRVAHGENERAMMEDMYGWMDDIFRAAGAEVLRTRNILSLWVTPRMSAEQRAWEPIPKPACSTLTANLTTSRICSLPTEVVSSRFRARMASQRS